MLYISDFSETKGESKILFNDLSILFYPQLNNFIKKLNLLSPFVSEKIRHTWHQVEKDCPSTILRDFAL